MSESAETVVRGMRGKRALLWESSVLDLNEGIRFRGHHTPECQGIPPKARHGNEMLPEVMFEIVLTGQVPSEKHVREFSQDTVRR